MPQKQRAPKNRFCINSNLSERDFLAILKQFCEGKVVSEARKTINRWRKRYGKKALSRQAVNTYFIRIGNHLYDHLVTDALSRLLGTDVRASLSLHGTEVMTEYRLDDDFLYMTWLDLHGELDNDSYARMVDGKGRGPCRGPMHDALITRMRKMRKFRPEHFRVHFTASFLQVHPLATKEKLEACAGIFAAVPLDLEARMPDRAVEIFRRKRNGKVFVELASVHEAARQFTAWFAEQNRSSPSQDTQKHNP